MASNSPTGAPKNLQNKPKPALRIRIPEPCTAEKIKRLSRGLPIDWIVVRSLDNSGLTCLYQNIISGETTAERPEKESYKSCAIAGGKRSRRKKSHRRKGKTIKRH